MAELYTFLDGAIADIRSKIDLEYQKRLAAHEKTISEELSAEDYTPDYGKINVVDALSHFYNEGYGSCLPNPPCNPQFTYWDGRIQISKSASEFQLPIGRWFIHYIPAYTEKSWQESGSGGYGSHYMVTSCSYNIYLIDNYGLIYTAVCDYTSTDKMKVTLWQLVYDVVLSAPSSKDCKYRLPNFLIDFCKKQTQIITNLSTLAEQYYKRFTAMKPLFTEGRFTDYESLLATKNSLEEQLATANTSLKAAKHTMADMLLEIEQLKATMATEAKKAADLALEVYRQLEAVRAERNTLHVELSDLRTSIISLADEAEVTHDSAIDAIHKKYIKIRESLEEAKAELVIATSEIDRYHANEENYVSQVFQQRQEITGYKKQLLALNSVESSPAPLHTPLNIEELVAQAVRKALEKPAPMPSLEVTDL